MRIAAFLACLVILIPWRPALAATSRAQLLKNLNSGKTDVRIQAIKKLGKLKDKKAVAPLIKLFKDKDPIVAWEAVKALGQIRDKRATGPLIKLLSGKYWDMRWAAVNALGNIRDKRAAQPLQNALDDDHQFVRSAAERALRKLGVKPAAKKQPDADKENGDQESDGFVLVNEEMPGTVYLGINKKVVFPAEATHKKYGYHCAQETARDNTGKVIAFCCDAATITDIPEACSKEDLNYLTLIGAGAGSAGMTVYKGKAGRTPREYEIIINVGQQSKQ